MKKLIRCLSLAVAAAFLALPLNACQAFNKVTDEKFFVFTPAQTASGQNGYTVKASALDMPSALIVPAEYNGLPVLGVEEHGFSGANCAPVLDVVFRSVNVEIGDYAFEGLPNLRSLEFRTQGALGQVKIGDFAFANCGKLAEMTFKTEAARFVAGSYSFSKTGLNALKLNAASVTLGDNAFESTSLASVEIPHLSALGNMAFLGCTELASFDVGGSYSSADGNLYNADGALVLYAPASARTEYTVNCDVLEKAFLGAKNLKKVTLGEQVKKVGRMAFAESSITELVYFCNESAFAENALMGTSLKPAKGNA